MITLPPGWTQALDSTVTHCYEKRIDNIITYRCYIFIDSVASLIMGWGVRKGSTDWIISRTFPIPIPLTDKNIQDRLMILIKQTFVSQL